MLKQPTLRGLSILTTILVMFQLALAQVMAASPELHHACDSHADDPGHECVVTMILNGGITTVAPDIIPEEISPEKPAAPVADPEEIDVVPTHLAGGVLAHAPPRGP